MIALLETPLRDLEIQNQTFHFTKQWKNTYDISTTLSNTSSGTNFMCFHSSIIYKFSLKSVINVIGNNKEQTQIIARRHKIFKWKNLSNKERKKLRVSPSEISLYRGSVYKRRGLFYDVINHISGLQEVWIGDGNDPLVPSLPATVVAPLRKKLAFTCINEFRSQYNKPCNKQHYFLENHTHNISVHSQVNV
jgi:hypothetical protein